MICTIASGEIDIREATWHWSALDPSTESPIGHPSAEAVFIRFRRPEDPQVELRCIVVGKDPAELSDDELRAEFGNAWAVCP